MIKQSLLAVSLSLVASQAIQAKTDDPFLWLEEVQGEKALEWVEKQNAHSQGYLQAQPLFKELAKKNLAV